MSGRVSKAAVLAGVGNISIQTFPLPEIREDDALLKVEMVGICGSDVGMYKGKTKRVQKYFPIILGHEIVGRIEEAGDLFSARHNVGRGDRVIVEFTFGCGFCDACIAGNYRLCAEKGRYGSYISCNTPPHLWGGYSEFLYLPPRAMVHKIGEEIPAEAAVVVTAVLGNAIRWVSQKGGASIGDTVVVEGPGPQGITAVVAARESGASKVVVTGLAKDLARLKTAQMMGADHIVEVDKEDPVELVRRITAGKMADMVIDVTGSAGAARTALDLLRPGGTFIMPGTYGTDVEIPLYLDKIVVNELRLLGVYSHDTGSVVPAIKLMETRKYPFEKMVTHRFDLEHAELGVRTVAGDIEGESPVKAVICPNG